MDTQQTVGTPTSLTPRVLLTVAEELARHRADALMEGREAPPGLSTFAGGEIQAGRGFIAAEAAATKALTARRQLLAEAGEQYSDARTEVTARHVEASGQGLALIVEESTTLYYKRLTGEEPPLTSFKSNRKLRFDRAGGEWLLTGQQLLRGGGPLPVTEPLPDGVRAPALDVDVRGAASTEHPAVQDVKRLDTRAYNYAAMAAYARRHAHNYNRDYRTFSGKGGDCTNFISQCLRAGGWQDKPGWYKDYRNWWYNWFTQTWSWTSVDHWAGFALSSGRARALSHIWQLSLGDILQLDFTSNRSRDHSMIVSARSSSTPYLSYHTRNTLDRSLVSITLANPRATYYPMRT